MVHKVTFSAGFITINRIRENVNESWKKTTLSMKVVAASCAAFDRYRTDGMKKYSTEIQHDADLSSSQLDDDHRSSSCNDVMVPSRENSISNERTR